MKVLSGSLLFALAVTAKQMMWSDLPMTGPGPRAAATMTCVGCEGSDAKLVLFGGEDHWRAPLSDTWSFHPATRAWKLVLSGGPVPPARRAHSAVLIGDEVVIFGGSEADAVRDDLWAYSSKRESWREVAPSGGSKPGGRHGHSAQYAVDQGSMLVLGGGSSARYFHKYYLYDDLWGFDWRRKTWESLGSTAFPAMMGASSAYDTSRQLFLVFGGWQGARYTYEKDLYFDGLYAYAAKSKSWHTLHPAARPYATAFASMQYSAEEDRVILFGGQHQGGTKTNELWEFILQESRWVKATVSGGPTLRRGASLAEMPQGFLLFGGKNDDYIFAESFLLSFRSSCAAGKAWNGTLCLDCPMGFYDSDTSLDAEPCVKCPAGRFTEKTGSVQCLPEINTFLDSVAVPQLRVQRDDTSGMLRVTVEAATLPARFVGLGAPHYTVDIAQDQRSLRASSACADLFREDSGADVTRLVAEFSYADLDEDCQLAPAQEQAAGLLHRSGQLGLFVVVPPSQVAAYAWNLTLSFEAKAAGLGPQPPVSRIVRLGDQIFDMGRFHSEIAFYSTVAYSDLKVPVRYVDGEVVFAEHKLEDAHLQMEISQVWISSSRIPEEVEHMTQNLTHQVNFETQGAQNRGLARFSFNAREQPCRQCFLHVLSKVSARRLEATPAEAGRMHALHSSVLTIAGHAPGTEPLNPVAFPVGYAVLVSSGGSIVVGLGWLPLQKRKSTRTTFLVVELLDLVVDWSMFSMTSDSGDLAFSNDDGWVRGLLLTSALLSSGLFVLEAFVLFWTEKKEPWRIMEVFHLSFEDTFQGLMYAYVAWSDAAQGDEVRAAVAGVALNLVFIFTKFTVDLGCLKST